jgi:HlyD family secretion protein
VRLQSKTVENVVNYTVVVEVENKDGRLLPGMTANVDFLTGMAKDVLLVPNAALRFRPTEAMLAERRENRMARAKAANGSPESGGGNEGGRRFGAPGGGDRSPRGSSGGGSFGGPPGAGQPGMGGPPGMDAMLSRMRANGGAVLWHVDDLGKLSITPVRLGLTDGQRTEVKSEDLTEGMSVIIGTVLTDPAGAQPASPFQAPQGGGSSRFRGPGGF